MSKAIDNLTEAMKFAGANRPRVGGFPYLAEVLRKAGVTRNVWSLPSCQSLYLTQEGPVVMQGAPLINGAVDVPAFDEKALIKALRVDQAGESTFPEFLDATWRAGVIRYDVDLEGRTVAYQSWNGDEYIEAYPAVVVA
ncbi:DUF1398 domain-containing protein [Granulicella sp. WH15]|uniref:DUF1398 domain-containing protein n=1 Tax=Granulicella sp. WH15 TaxID=2602070 RepID=UPI001366A3AE|nr:DUF1398 family protein [Granulicella sp. WH15]QHN04157.1 DUF1398 domain-containing protein [Granulicella sp. WH15]